VKGSIQVGVIAICFLSSLCMGQSAEVQGLGYRFLPSPCIELALDRFNMLRPCNERICTLTEEVRSMRAAPACGPSSNMHFKGGGSWLEVCGFSTRLRRQVPFFRLEARGSELFCKVLTVPRKDVDAALTEFREWLKTGVFEYTTKGGQIVRLTLAVPLETVTVSVSASFAAEFKTQPCEPSDTEVFVIPLEQSTWKEDGSAPGKSFGSLNGMRASVVVEAGVCRIRFRDEPIEQLRLERKKLQRMKSLEPLLTAPQQRIYSLELAPQELLIRSLEAEIAALQSGQIEGSWFVVVRERSSGHLFGTAVIRGRGD